MPCREVALPAEESPDALAGAEAEQHGHFGKDVDARVGKDCRERGYVKYVTRITILFHTDDFVEYYGDLDDCKGGRQVRAQGQKHLERCGASHG